VPPYSGKIGALQQAGQMQTEAAQQANLANKWSPVPGLPRVAGRYSPNIERVPEAEAGVREALINARTYQNAANAFENIIERFGSKDARAAESAAPLFQRPSMQSALAYAKSLAAERGYAFPRSVDDQFSVQNLHDIKLGLDATITKGANKNAPTALDNTTLAAINDTKSKFLGWVEYKVPQYGSARQSFARDMAPVNQMTVIQGLKDKLLNPKGQMSPGSYLGAIKDEERSIKNLLGQSRSDFGDFLTPNQRGTVSEVGGLLERRLAANNPQSPVSIGGKNVAEESVTPFPNMLYRPAMIANWVLKLGTQGSSKLESQTDEILTAWMADPKAFADAMRQLPPSRVREISDILRRSGVSPMNQGLLGPIVIGTTKTETE
jgi:hypothetical protein